MSQAFPSVGELYAQSLNNFGNDAAIIDTGGTLSYRELAQRVGSIIAAYDSIGLKPGDRVALTLNVGTEFVAMYLAAQIAGLGVIEVAPQLPWDLLEYRIRVANASASFFASKDIPAAAHDKIAALPGQTFSLGEASFASDFSGIVRKSEPAPVVARVNPGPGAINFTSGSTGNPKAIALNASAAAGQAILLMATVNHPVRPVCVLGMTHPVVMHLLMTPTLIRGGTVVTAPSTDLDVVVKAAKEHRANMLFLATRMLYQLLDAGGAEWMKGQVELFYYGGENMTVDRLKEAITRCGSIFAQIYGTQESGPCAVLRPQDHDPSRPDQLGSVGRPIAGAALEVRDDSGRVLPPNQPGYLLLKTRTAMDEYIGQPEKTRETLIDGWVKPGDVGYKDRDGFIYMLDRETFALVVDGHKIFPRTIEMSLGEHPAVGAVVAMGVADAQGEKRLCVAVQPRRGATLSSGEVSALVRKAHQVDPHRVIFVEEFALNPVSRKIDRPKLEEQFKQHMA